ncbi:MAG: L-serine ammonia-lyase [Acidobacteria bacterium]|nr:L-serine ammonia-lyase [Acidobacteriota bacterium]
MRASQVSAFQTLKMSLGPSSSHTHGPILIGNRFRQTVEHMDNCPDFDRLEVVIYWSLARTGKGHMTDNAILAGLSGLSPVDDDLEIINNTLPRVQQTKQLEFAGRTLEFHVDRDLVWAPDEQLPEHENGLALRLYRGEEMILERRFYSIGGGMIKEEGEGEHVSDRMEPHPYQYAAEWVMIARREGVPLSSIVKRNTCAVDGIDRETCNARMMRIWQVMKTCIERGLNPTEPILPGLLKVKRRAPRLHLAASHPSATDIFGQNDLGRLATAFAYAVSEENAASGRVVTAPTNGGAGVVPGVLRACQLHREFSDSAVVNALFTAAGIGGLIQANASISGSEVGCQGEVGAACSMAAAAVAQLYGGDIYMVEYAAEIAMEHSLGLECTPMQGYVQIPCIERNGIYAQKALASAQHAMTLQQHRISLDLVIRKMYENGKHMDSDFKETSRAGFGPIEPDLNF